MKNIYAVITSIIIFSALALGHLFVSSQYLAAEYSAFDSHIANILQPLFVIVSGYVCVKISTFKKWWFAASFGIVTYIFMTLYVVVSGQELNPSSWVAALKVPFGLVVFSLLGGGIYQYLSAKH